MKSSWPGGSLLFLFRDGKYLFLTNVMKDKEVMEFYINLTGKPTPIEVHLVPGPLPFIMG